MYSCHALFCIALEQMEQIRLRQLHPHGTKLAVQWWYTGDVLHALLSCLNALAKCHSTSLISVADLTVVLKIAA